MCTPARSRPPHAGAPGRTFQPGPRLAQLRQALRSLSGEVVPALDPALLGPQPAQRRPDAARVRCRRRPPVPGPAAYSPARPRPSHHHPSLLRPRHRTRPPHARGPAGLFDLLGHPLQLLLGARVRGSAINPSPSCATPSRFSRRQIAIPRRRRLPGTR
ncbi:hypothetical protein HBB16_18985 [Pseudonocardia sp. MCCB 268]|nr:hypothetical protein [Pseudonocardia cytotoxica]